MSIPHRSEQLQLSMTADMRAVVEDFGSMTGEELRLCCEKYLAAYKAGRASMPSPGGNPVTPEARAAFFAIEHYWLNRLQALLRSGINADMAQGLLQAHPDPIINTLVNHDLRSCRPATA